MKKLIAIFTLLTSSSVMSFAQAEQSAEAQQPDTSKHAPFYQPRYKPEELAERQTKMYEKRLTLNKKQYQKVYETELDYWQQYQKIRINISEPDPVQLNQLITDRNEGIKNVLTPEQLKKFEASLPIPAHKAPTANLPPPPPAQK